MHFPSRKLHVQSSNTEKATFPTGAVSLPGLEDQLTSYFFHLKDLKYVCTKLTNEVFFDRLFERQTVGRRGVRTSPIAPQPEHFSLL